MTYYLMIVFTLHQPLRDYNKIHAAVRQLGKEVKVMDTTYYVTSTYDVATARDFLMKHVDSNDSVFVAETKPHAWAAFNVKTATLLPGAVVPA